MVFRRLSGKTENTAPVLALITQFGGGKTHTLTALYHLVRHRGKIKNDEEINKLFADAGLTRIPDARVAVFVGNAWDPAPGAETPWVDIARQLAGDAGGAALGAEAKTKVPGTNNLRKLIEAAGGMIVLPGTAILVIPLGLAILATEFVWARKLLNKFKDKFPRQKED
jgi:hypothetical protein